MKILLDSDDELEFKLLPLTETPISDPSFVTKDRTLIFIDTVLSSDSDGEYNSAEYNLFD
ncbi:15107_t:CDS:2 [Funneliformis caledonium]|uniref:15107_t:CDS:1 n=1 Tax=Funneliformis caledonium TaxID=1117310 RepID=A0A9N9AE69_9GLOM|nr:15107_t:CDS:2 [Funneliformis caledonium]